MRLIRLQCSIRYCRLFPVDYPLLPTVTLQSDEALTRQNCSNPSSVLTNSSIPVPGRSALSLAPALLQLPLLTNFKK